MTIGARTWKRTAGAVTVTVMTGLGSVVIPAATTTTSAVASPTGVDRTPVMGWSSWSFLRLGVNSTNIEGEANALVSSGLAHDGYKYVNIDDNWYNCPGPQGPDVDSNGHWVVNDQEFPKVGAENGIAAVASYVHHLGLKFGIYETAGISKQAVARNTHVQGTSYTADQIATTSSQANYNCGGMVDLNYTSPGAQAYVDFKLRRSFCRSNFPNFMDQGGAWKTDSHAWEEAAIARFEAEMYA